MRRWQHRRDRVGTVSPSDSGVLAVAANATTDIAIDLSLIPGWASGQPVTIFTDSANAFLGSFRDDWATPSAAIPFSARKLVRTIARSRFLVGRMSSGTGTIRVWGSNIRAGIDFQATDPFMGLTAVAGSAPSLFLHADSVDGVIGSAPTSYGQYSKANITQAIPPVLSTGWIGGRRTLNFAGNRALRVDAVGSSLPDAGGPFTAVFALVIPNSATNRGIFDFQQSSLPTSRYFDAYVTAGNLPSLYVQTAAGATSPAMTAVSTARWGVPQIYGITKHTSTMDLLWLDSTGELVSAEGLSHARTGAVPWDVVTIGAEYNGSTYGVFMNGLIRAAAFFTTSDLPSSTLRALMSHFATKLDCPLS